MSEKIKKRYADTLIAGAAVRDANGKVISESLEAIDNKASLLDNVVVSEISDTLNNVRTGGTIIAVGETANEEIQETFIQEDSALRLSYIDTQPEPKEYELQMPESVTGASDSNEQPNLTLSYIH